MSEWTTDDMIEGLRSFSGTDTRERFYEACAATIERLARDRKILRTAVEALWVETDGMQHQIASKALQKTAAQPGESPDE